MMKTYSQMHRADSQHSSINWLVWLNSRVFIYELRSSALSPVVITYTSHIVNTAKQFLEKLILQTTSQKYFLILKVTYRKSHWRKPLKKKTSLNLLASRNLHKNCSIGHLPEVYLEFNRTSMMELFCQNS